MNRLRAGRAILSLVALFTGTSAYVADWNETHLYNPHWPPHARFHNAQTLVLAAASALLALWFLWRRGDNPLLRLNVASLFAGFYWICLLPSILFPGTAFFDPSLVGRRLPSVLGLELNQAHGGVFFLVLIAGANWLERRALKASSGEVPAGQGR